MDMVRKIFLGIAGVLLAFFLFILAIDDGLIRAAGSPGPIKHILAGSGIYSSIVPSNLDQAKQITADSRQVSLTDPLVRSAAESTFSPQFVQTTSENVIDSIYRWLNGQTPLPDFKIDLTAKKATFADKVAAGVQQKAASLPRCTSALTSASFDAFNATCLPPGVSPPQVADTVRSDILNGQGFLNDPLITADSIKSNDSNKSIFVDQLKNAPNVFQAIKATSVIFGLLAVLALLAIIFLSRPRLKGLRHAGFILIGIGIFLVLFALAVNSAVKNKALPKINTDNKVLQADLRQLTNDSVQKVDNTVLAFGGGYIVLGALGISGFYFSHRRRNVEEAPVDTPPEPMITESKAAEKPAKPKSKPKVKKIDVK